MGNAQIGAKAFFQWRFPKAVNLSQFTCFMNFIDFIIIIIIVIITIILTIIMMMMMMIVKVRRQLLTCASKLAGNVGRVITQLQR